MDSELEKVFMVSYVVLVMLPKKRADLRCRSGSTGATDGPKRSGGLTVNG